MMRLLKMEMGMKLQIEIEERICLVSSSHWRRGLAFHAHFLYYRQWVRVRKEVIENRNGHLQS